MKRRVSRTTQWRGRPRGERMVVTLVERTTRYHARGTAMVRDKER